MQTTQITIHVAKWKCVATSHNMNRGFKLHPGIDAMSSQGFAVPVMVEKGWASN
jgi:hypothetical protein